MPNSSSVDISIATFRRPLLLDRLLKSIGALNLSGITLRVIVVDNDDQRSAERVVRKHQKRELFPLIYDVEPEQNIALTRNRGLSHVEAEWVAFIDDDETADPDWLVRLLSAAREYQADVVFGPVIPVLPDDTPEWCRRGGFFERPRFPTGTTRPWGGTGNTLVRTRFLREQGISFEPSFGLTGGEDTELFRRVAARGGRMIWCDEAVVWEAVHPERMTVGWLIRRAYREGMVYSRIFAAGRTRLGKLAWAAKRLFYVGVAVTGVVTVGLFWKEGRIQSLRKVAANLGQMKGLYNGSPCEEYRCDA